MYCDWIFCSAGAQAVGRETRDVDKIKLAGNFTIEKVHSGGALLIATPKGRRFDVEAFINVHLEVDE